MEWKKTDSQVKKEFQVKSCNIWFPWKKCQWEKWFLSAASEETLFHWWPSYFESISKHLHYILNKLIFAQHSSKTIMCSISLPNREKNTNLENWFFWGIKNGLMTLPKWFSILLTDSLFIHSFELKNIKSLHLFLNSCSRKCWLSSIELEWESNISLTEFGLIWFYGTSTIVGYLMPNPLYTYILCTYK